MSRPKPKPVCWIPAKIDTQVGDLVDLGSVRYRVDRIVKGTRKSGIDRMAKLVLAKSPTQWDLLDTESF